MILHRDNISIQGEYRLCESTFVDIDVRLMPGLSGLLCASFTVTDALRNIQGNARSELFPLAQLALATAECLRIDLEVVPQILPQDLRLGDWHKRTLNDRAMICLHAVYDNEKAPGKRNIGYLDFLLRVLEHAPGLQLVFGLEEDRVARITALFGDQDRGKFGFAVEGVPSRDNEIKERSFVPLSETSET